MPFKSEAQRRLFQAAAHGWKKPGGGGPSQEVARKFIADSEMEKQRAQAKLLRKK